jgi:hypothetical protein
MAAGDRPVGRFEKGAIAVGAPIVGATTLRHTHGIEEDGGLAWDQGGRYQEVTR